MNRISALSLVVAAFFLTVPSAASAQNRAGDIGAGPIDGMWTVTGAERDGNPWRDIAAAMVTIGGGQFSLEFANGGPVYKGEVKPAGGQQLVDFVHREGPDAGKTWEALVSSNGQLLKICFAYGGENPRPTSLTTSPGEGTTLIGLRRR